MVQFEQCGSLGPLRVRDEISTDERKTHNKLITMKRSKKDYDRMNDNNDTLHSSHLASP